MHQSQVKRCFLRGPLRCLTEKKNPKFLWRLQNAQRVFWVFKTNVSIFRVISFYASWKFLLWLGNSAWDFLGDKLWSSDLFGFCLKSKGFYRVLIFAPIRSSLSLEIRSTSSGLELSWKGRWIFHPFHPKLIYIFLTGNCVGERNEKKTKSSYCHKMHLKLKIPGNFGGF